ncbi:hypothetical protein Q3H58_005203 [Pseudomonas psychrotolerans]|nr:hypothetical protein [Pseudomonas psychrotolerans]
MAGMMMCDGFSPASWMMYSPMSDSRQSIPWAPRTWFMSISSLTMDLPLISSLASWRSAICWTMALASAVVSAQCTWTPLRVRFASRRSSNSGSLDSARARMRLPSSRSRSRSSASLMLARRLAISESMAVRKLRRNWSSPRARRARALKGGVSLTSVRGIFSISFMRHLQYGARGSWPGVRHAGRHAVSPGHR